VREYRCIGELKSKVKVKSEKAKEGYKRDEGKTRREKDEEKNRVYL